MPVDDRTSGDGAARAEREPDPLVAEIVRERRDRRVLVVAAAIGIIASAIVGMAVVLGAIGGAAYHARGHALLIFVLGPPLVSMAIGHAIFALRRRGR